MVAVIYLTLSKSYGSTCQIDCIDLETARKPSEEKLKQMYNEWLGEDNELHKTFEMMPPLYKTRYKNHIPDSKRNLNRSRIYGDPKCHKRLNKASSNLMDNSLCPWYIEMTYDMERYPEYMARARCKCKHCYNFYGLRPKRLKRFNTPLCKEMKETFKVLRISKNAQGKPFCDSNNRTILHYQKSYEEVTVGCVCALRRDVIARTHIHKTRD